MWTLGIIGALNYEITVLTALIPPLIIVIGIPNCIFLINKYQQVNRGNLVERPGKSVTLVYALLNQAYFLNRSECDPLLSRHKSSAVIR